MDSPAPGGGSIAALCGAMSASLSCMVSNLTVGKKGYEDVQEKVKELAVKAQALKDDFLLDIDLDTLAFNKVMDTFKMKKKTIEEKEKRAQAIENATKEATLIPYHVLENCISALKIAKEVAVHGNKNSLSDAGVASLTAEAGALGAFYNVKINLPDIEDEKFKSDIKRQASDLLKKALDLGTEIKDLLLKELK